MKLIYSLAKRTIEPHSDIVYKTFWVSMKNSKEMGHEIELWGTTDAIEKLGELADSIVNVDDFDFELYDDIKMKIWEGIKPYEITIDGDVFLCDSNLKMGGLWLNVDNEFKILSNEGKLILDTFNKFNPQQIIPEWDSTNTIGLSTGLVNWGMNEQFKKHYIESYWKLRNWYFENQYEMVMKNAKIHNMYPAISHIICENLLYQLVKYYGIEYKELNNNPNFKYIHKAGEEKYKNNAFVAGISTLFAELKFRNDTVQNLYTHIVKGGMRPFIFLDNN
jgi:hypothetical protein